MVNQIDPNTVVDSYSSSKNIIVPLINIALGGLVAWLTVWAKMAKYQQKVDDLKEDKITMMTKLEGLRTDVDTLKEFKVSAQKFIDKSLYESKSPLSLTDFGKKLVDESGFVGIFEIAKTDLVTKLNTKNPKTKYDAQEMARQLMDELVDYAPFAPIKDYAFKSGTDFGQILRAGAIILRDYYLSLHPEIKT